MKTKLQTALALIAPSLSIQTLWSHDDDASFTAHGMTKPGGCFHGESPDDWQAWNSEIQASAIVNGELVTGSAYLSGTWEKAGDNPAESNPEISGYENQMTEEALEELLSQVQPSEDDAPCMFSLTTEIKNAIAHLKAESRASYEAQRAALETT